MRLAPAPRYAPATPPGSPAGRASLNPQRTPRADRKYPAARITTLAPDVPPGPSVAHVAIKATSSHLTPKKAG